MASVLESQIESCMFSLLNDRYHAITFHIVVLKDVGQVNKRPVTGELALKTDDGHRGANVGAFDLTLIPQVEHFKQVSQHLLSEGRAEFWLQVLDQNLCLFSIILLKQAIFCLLPSIFPSGMPVMFELSACYRKSQTTKAFHKYTY